MVEVLVTLPTRSVYLAGETIFCNIIFTNKGHHGKDGSPQKNKAVKLAWASAQVHCQCTVNDSKMVIPRPQLLSTDDVSTTGKETSFVASKGEKGFCLLSTTPVILFCDITLLPGETRSFTYKQALPLDCPPSYRGVGLKYSYKVTVGAQRLRHDTRLIRVPFRVLILPGLSDISIYNEDDECKPTNPFLKKQQKENTILDLALEILQTITCRRAISYYNVTNASGSVAQFCLFKQAFRIGDDIIGVCDFSDSVVPCVQFSVTLQSEESVVEEYRKKTASTVTVTSYSKHEEFCLHTSKTHISIPIPLTATPTFISEFICLRWRLHFEFVTSRNPIPPPPAPQSPSDSVVWQGPAELDVDTMVWDLPIKVFATSPVQADTVSLLKTDNTMVI